MTCEVIARRRRPRQYSGAMRLPVVLLALLLGGCVAALRVPPQAGQSEADALARLGKPTARHALAGGGSRLEFASGPYGRETWMVDIDAAGRVLDARQVLAETELVAFQARAPGLSRDELLRSLGTPGERRRGGWSGGEVWSWRYPTNDCLWFQASIGDDGIVREGSFGSDPRCDAPSDGARGPG